MTWFYVLHNKGNHCSPQEGVEGDTPLPGDFRVIVCPTPPQMNDFCDLLGTPDAPVSKIASVKSNCVSTCVSKKEINLDSFIIYKNNLLNATLSNTSINLNDMKTRCRVLRFFEAGMNFRLFSNPINYWGKNVM